MTGEGILALKNLFTEKARAVSAEVVSLRTISEALDYTVDLCDRRAACELMVSGCEADLSEKAKGLCEEKQEKIIAAPNLGSAEYDALAARCRPRGLGLIRKDLRRHLAGLDVGLTWMDWGLAETGTLVLDSSQEDIRLATMISEVHVAMLRTSRIRVDGFDIESDLVRYFKSPPNYTAFITGASRTADIERVLALGVHGPLELHILLLEDR